MKQICIIDYKLGNIASIFNSIKDLTSNVIVSDKENDLKNSSHIILPGVGSFKAGMQSLKNINLIDLLNNEIIVKKKNVSWNLFRHAINCK